MANKDLEVGVKITADAKGLKAETGASKEALNDLGATAKKTGSESAAAAQQYTDKLKRQAETVGMTAAQTRAYDAAQLDLNSAQRASVVASNSAISSGERHHALIERMRLAVMGLAVAIGAALVGALKSSASMAAQAEQSYLRVQAVLAATGNAAGLTGAELDAMAEGMKERFGFDDDTMRDAMAKLLIFRSVSRDSFGGALEAAANLSVVMQTDLGSAVLAVGKALEEPVEGLTALGRAGIKFDATQKEMFKTMVEGGRQTEAINLILRELDARMGGVSERMNQGMTRATRDAGLAWDDLLKSMGRTPAIKGSVEGVFGGITDSLRGLKQLVDSGDWIDKIKFLLPASAGAIIDRLPRAGFAGTAPAQNSTAAMQASADALAGLTRQQLAQEAEVKALALAKQAEEAAKKREEAAKRAAAATQQAIEGARHYITALQLETEQVGLNVIQKRLMAAAAEAAKAPTAALRQEIMASAQAWAEHTAADASAARLYIDTLKAETEQIGLNVIQKRLMAAATEAAKAPTAALRLEIMAAAQAWAELTSGGTDLTRLTQMETDFRATLSRMQVLQDGINIKRQSGLLTEAQARSQISDLLQQTATDLDLLLPKMQALADASGGEAVTRIAGLRNEVARLRIETDQYAVRFAGTVRNSLQGLFQGLMLGQENVFSSMVQNFKQAMAAMVAEALAAKLMESLFGGLGGFASIGALFGVKTPVKKAAGGLISGPGSGTSDSIPALLSDGEYVLRNAAVRHWGVGMLDSLNNLSRAPSINGGRLAFAGGGLVQAPRGASSAPANVTNINIGIGDDVMHLTMRDFIERYLAGIAMGGK